MTKKTLFPPIAAVIAALLLSMFVACNENVVPKPELLDRAPDPDKGWQFLLARIYGQSVTINTGSIDTIYTVWPEPLRSIAANARTVSARR